MCSVTHRDRYRLRDRFGKPTQIGKIIKSDLEQSLSEIMVGTVCIKCKQTFPTTARELQQRLQLKQKLKALLRGCGAGQGPTQTPRAPSRAPVAAAVSPSAQSMSISPAQQ